jgi:hypothetical protein
MAGTTLKSLHRYLRLIENPSELKRKLPASTNPRSLKEGLSEISKLAGLDNAAFKDPQNIAAVIGPQRFVTIWGEPSVTGHVARIFDGSKVLLAVLIDSGQVEKATGVGGLSNSNPEVALENLKPLLAGNLGLTCRLFRALFEHMLGFAPPAIAQQGGATLVNELAGSKEHGRSFLSTAMFILGAEIDRENLMSFMLEQGLFGLQLFEHLLQNREYCDAFYTFRKLERVFVGPLAEEEKQLRSRMDRFNEQYGGKPGDVQIFETRDQDKARVDAHLAAVDLLEAMALTPLSLCLNNAIAAAPSNTVRFMKIMARHFECFAAGKETKEQANQEIASHLLAFARQFSADSKAAHSPDATPAHLLYEPA